MPVEQPTQRTVSEIIKETISNSRQRTDQEFSRKTKNSWSASFMTDVGTVYMQFQYAVRNKEIKSAEDHTKIELALNKIMKEVRTMIEIDLVDIRDLKGDDLIKGLKKTEPPAEKKERLFKTLDTIGKAIIDLISKK